MQDVVEDEDSAGREAVRRPPKVGEDGELEVGAVDDSWNRSDAEIVRQVDASFRGSSLGALPEGPSRVERLPEIISVQGRGALARRDRFVARTERSPRLVFATSALTTPDLEGRVTIGMRAAAEAISSLDAPLVEGGDPADAPGDAASLAS